MSIIYSSLLDIRRLIRWIAGLMASSLLAISYVNAHVPFELVQSVVSDTANTSTENVSRKVKSRVLEFSGFIKYDLFADTRQVVNAREGLVSLYPENRFYDAFGQDINEGLNVNMLAIHSRLGLRTHGPTVLNAHTSGFIEADFYGNANSHFSDLNGLRLFNAYIDFRWNTTELLVGQYWHPMSVREFFPNTVSFSAGAPFHPMSRNPQVRIRQTLGGFKLMGAVLSQRDFTSTGPDGPSSQYLRNAGVPNIHLQLQYGSDSSTVSGGAGIDHKRLVPTLSTTNDVGEVFKSNRSISSVSFIGFVKVKTEYSGLTAQGVYAQNAYDLLMLGGYAEQHVGDAYTGGKHYTNLDVASFWVDAYANVQKIHFGAFIGYTQNMGSDDAVDAEIYSRGGNIGWVYRFSPRVAYGIGSVDVAIEGEYTIAGYGIENGDGKGRVTKADPVGNFRSLLSLKYSF